MPQITLTLEQLGSFVKKLANDTIRNKALINIVPVLKDSLKKNVFTNHNDTVRIKDKAELKRLIRSKGKGISGDPYNSEYLEKKRKLGENLPHKYRDYGFWSGTEVEKKGDQVVMSTPHSTDPAKKGRFKQGSHDDYLSYHETQRSVLKLAFLRAWQDIISTTINTYKEEAQKC